MSNCLCLFSLVLESVKTQGISCILNIATSLKSLINLNGN